MHKSHPEPGFSPDETARQANIGVNTETPKNAAIS